MKTKSLFVESDGFGTIEIVARLSRKDRRQGYSHSGNRRDINSGAIKAQNRKVRHNTAVYVEECLATELI